MDSWLGVHENMHVCMCVCKSTVIVCLYMLLHVHVCMYLFVHVLASMRQGVAGSVAYPANVPKNMEEAKPQRNMRPISSCDIGFPPKIFEA